MHKCCRLEKILFSGFRRVQGKPAAYLKARIDPPNAFFETLAVKTETQYMCIGGNHDTTHPSTHTNLVDANLLFAKR